MPKLEFDIPNGWELDPRDGEHIVTVKDGILNIKAAVRNTGENWKDDIDYFVKRGWRGLVTFHTGQVYVSPEVQPMEHNGWKYYEPLKNKGGIGSMPGESD